MDTFKSFNVTRSEGKLRNGIKVMLFQRSGAPITTTAILKSGSKYDPDSMFGVAHFLEHMIVNGSQEFPTKDLLAEHIESVGGSYGAKTGQDPMWVNTEVSEKDDYERVVDIFNATLCKPLMDKKVFENEKQVVIKEIQKSNSNPSQLLAKTVRQLFFKNTPFEHQILGDEKSITNLRYEDMMLEYKKLFDKSRITFVASGDISIDELVTRLNTLYFLEGNDFVQKDDVCSISEDKKILATFFDAPQTYICFGVPAPKSFSKELLHLNLLGDILAGGRASRLIKRLRYNKGLVYGVTYGRSGGLEFGSWRISTDTTENKVQEVINEIIEEIKDIRNNGVKDSELEFVKIKRVKSLKRTMQTSNDWVDFHASAEVFSSEIYNINTFVKDIEETTIEDIKLVVDTYLVKNKWQLALCGRTKEESINIKW
jgi:predicted Zn-dependent peptidase